MLIKKTNELNRVLNEVKTLIETTEKHIICLMNSCITTEQMQCLLPYSEQLYRAIIQISSKYKCCLWWRKMYQEEIQMMIKLSFKNIHDQIIEKINQNYDQKRSN